MFYLARNLTGEATPDVHTGLKVYMLVDTAQFMEDVYFGSSVRIEAMLDKTPTKFYSTLSP